MSSRFFIGKPSLGYKGEPPRTGVKSVKKLKIFLVSAIGFDIPQEKSYTEIVYSLSDYRMNVLRLCGGQRGILRKKVENR